MAPWPDAVMAAAAPAGPPPITIRSYTRQRLPRDRAHAEKIMTANLHMCCCSPPKHLFHFFDGVRLSHGSRGVMACEAAAIERIGRVRQRQMHRASHKIVDEHSDTADAQRFVHGPCQRIRRKVMGEQAGTDQVEPGVGERKSESIGGNPMDGSAQTSCQVRDRPVQNSYFKANTAGEKPLLNLAGSGSIPCRNLQ